MSDVNVGVECGVCGGDIYFATCEHPEHDWALRSVCTNCGERHEIKSSCPDCDAFDVFSRAEVTP